MHDARDDADWRADAPAPLSSTTPSPLPALLLPEVRDLLDDGWLLAPDEPLFAFLPAVWHATHRAWLHDRSTHYSVEYVDDGPGRLVALTGDEADDFATVLDEACALAG